MAGIEYSSDGYQAIMCWKTGWVVEHPVSGATTHESGAAYASLNYACRRNSYSQMYRRLRMPYNSADEEGFRLLQRYHHQGLYTGAEECWALRYVQT